MTGTIEPTITPAVSRASKEVRLNDYKTALDFYCKKLSPSDASLLFVENSGYDLGDLVRVAKSNGHRLQTISYTEDTDAQARGKGVGEARMFDYIAKTVDEQQNLYTSVAKVTGRLLVQNIKAVVRQQILLNHIQCRVSFDRTQIDTRFIRVSTPLWRQFCGLSDEVRESEGVFLEHVVHRRLAQLSLTQPTWQPFDRQPRFLGHSGSTGARYGGPRAFLMDRVADLSNRALRSWYS